MEKATIKTVTLNVADLAGQLAFYQQVIGLRLHSRENGLAILGADHETPLLNLQEKPGGKRYNGYTGLYHFAILVPSRYHLALSLNRLIETNAPMQGASDHLVSEALYLADPEGNGIEIYRDRPRDEWVVDGQLQMASLPLQFDQVMAQVSDGVPAWHGLDPSTIIGHIHLHVRDIAVARKFYTQFLGMQEMATMPSATFLSYEGYHHHLGANTWSGRMPPPEDGLGLDHFTIQVDTERLTQIRASFDQQGVSYKNGGSELTVEDSSLNTIKIIT